MPTSPIPPDRASGEMRRKGTAVVTILIGAVVCEKAKEKQERFNNKQYNALNLICFIESILVDMEIAE